MNLVYIFRKWPDGRWVNEHGPLHRLTATFTLVDLVRADVEAGRTEEYAIARDMP